MEQAAKDQPQVRRIGRPPKAEVNTAGNTANPAANEAAQALASRIWDGQSCDLPRAERMRRVAAGLEAQGMSMEGVSL